jgi:UDP:flavonoid glycosyltransferase YjiC (YdhE family)
VRTTGFPLFDQGERDLQDPELRAWMAAGSAPVVVTAGSANLHGRAFYEASIEACRVLDHRTLLVTSNRDLLPDALPEGVRHESYVPFSHVLPQAAALISHGGIGTTVQGLAAGIPQLVRPLAFDQFDNVSRLETLGVGASLPAGRYNAKRAARLLEGLLTSSDVQAACSKLQARLPSADVVLDETCRLLEDL